MLKLDHLWYAYAILFLLIIKFGLQLCWSNFQGIPTAPLWDFCKGQFVGVLSAMDFILILREVMKFVEFNIDILLY